jgi:hypothetical protein
MKTTLFLLTTLFGLCFSPSLAGQEARLAGHWEGAIVLAPAEQELDVVVDLSRTAGQLKGRLWFPITGDGAHEVQDLAAQGSHVSFAVRDDDGVVSHFDGTLSPDGNSVRGTLKEGGQSAPFGLQRARSDWQVRPIPIHKLSPGALQLKMDFNADAGKTRLLLLLTMGSFTSKMALRIVERFVLEPIRDPNLRVYVVWMAPNTAQTAKVLQQGAGLAPDPRVTEYWSDDPAMLKVFQPMMAFYKQASDPCLLFAPGKVWMRPAPVPDRIRQTAGIGGKIKLPPGEKLNGIELAKDVQTLLPRTSKGR